MSLSSVIIERRYRYVHPDVDRHGNVRTYFRRSLGQKKIRIRERPGTEEFDRRYRELLAQSEAGALKLPPSTAPTPGTLRWLGCQWLASPDYTQRDPRSQRVTQLILEAIYREPIESGSALVFGDCPLKRFTATSVRILRDRKADKPEGANNRVRRLRALFNWAAKPENNDRGVTVNPARDVTFLKPKRIGGFPPWELEHLDKFEAHHAEGTKARLAYELLYFGCRRSDVVRLGRQHIRDGRIRFTAFKGRNKAPVVIDMEVSEELLKIIEATPTGDLTFLVTKDDKPFTANGFGNWFRERCDEVGLLGLSAHGLRKAAATRAAEAGATAHELQAMFGWLTLAQAENYTRKARRRLLADSGMRKVRTNRVENFPTLEAPSAPVGKSAAKR